MMMRSGRCRRAAATSWLGVTATWPGIARDGFPAHCVGMCDLQLGGLLDYDESFLHRNVIEQGFHQGRLPRAGSACDNAVLPARNQVHDGIPNTARQAARCDQFIRG